ncbi:MAG TPA: hypothetical protein VM865_05320, partial [Acidobacteriaceae bacterium]|nr:hypothetical protein [Acidobacteriaceae bacterium]
MSPAIAPQELSFSEEQKVFLRTFFTEAMSRAPFAGHLSSGRITHQPQGDTANLAAPAEPTFHGVPVSDLCAEEVWKFERNPLDAWDALLACASENSAPDAEHRFRFKFHGLFY